MTKRILVILGLVTLVSTGAQGSQELLTESIKEARMETARAAEQLKTLKDIQKILTQDVTQAGVKAVRSTVSDANWRYKAVNATFKDALKEVDRMEKSLSTESK